MHNVSYKAEYVYQNYSIYISSFEEDIYNVDYSPWPRMTVQKIFAKLKTFLESN